MMRLGRAALLAVFLLLLCGCTRQKPEEGGADWESLEFERSLELLFANQFSVDYYSGGYKKITIRDGGEYLVVPEGAPVPSNLPETTAVLQQPLDSIYLAATSAMDLFRELDAIDAISLSGTDASGWYIPEAREAIEAGRMTYAGKYSAPDYELILAHGCDLAVESTMIYHTPKVKEQLERSGIPVLVERSSYEGHPLGRMEWLKLYAALLNKEDEAEASFSGQMETLSPILERENTGKTVAFFYITSNGAVSVRVPESIWLAGGVYILQDLPFDGSAKSTMNIQMETFYEAARDADILIYNSTIDGELQTMKQLLDKGGLLQNFKAVQTGNVWCTGKNMFQESLGLGSLIGDLHAILTADTPDGLNLTYLHRLS